MFDAQTLSIALVKQAVEGGDSNTKVELAPAERSFRIEAQKKRLVGISFQGPYECSFSCYDIVSEMLDKDAAVYPQPQVKWRKKNLQRSWLLTQAPMFL